MKRKSILSVLLSLLILLGLTVPAFSEEPEQEGTDVAAVEEEPGKEVTEEKDVLKGDLDGDGSVTASDARLALRAAVGLDELADDLFLVADMDEDGNVTAADARIILRVAVGLPADESDVPEKPDEPVTPVYPPKPDGGLYPEPVNPHETPDQFTLVFNDVLYNHSHRFNQYSAAQMTSAWGMKFDPVGWGYRLSTDWCCYYTIKDVFRPVLETVGYSEAQMDKIAPRFHDALKVQRAIQKGVNLYIPKGAIDLRLIETYVPSLLADYYLSNPAYASTWTFTTYYDDIVTERAYTRSANADGYYPKVGDILFMTNKTSTFVNGLPTIDHTAQITKVYEDGTFLCTEGALMFDTPRVAERVYQFDRETGCWRYPNLKEVVTLVIARPNLKVSG